MWRSKNHAGIAFAGSFNLTFCMKRKGLPVTLVCFLPQLSTHGIASSIFWSRAVTPISRARRRMVSCNCLIP